MKVIQVWLRVFALFMVFLFSSVSLQAEGSWQMGLQEGDRTQALFQWNSTEGSSSQGITIQKRPLYVDILNPGEIINIHICGESDNDDLTIEIWDESGTIHLNRNDSSRNLSHGNVGCGDNFQNTLSGGYEYTPSAKGTYQIRLDNHAGSKKYLKRFDVYVKSHAGETVDPRTNQGRLWAKRWTFEGYSFDKDKSISSNLYAVIDGGFANSYYVWELNLNNFAGNTYEIVANGLGLSSPPNVNTTLAGLSACVDASDPSVNSSGTCSSVSGAVNHVEAVYPIYLSNPAKNYPNPTTIPEITNLKFLDDAGKDDSISPNGDGNQDTGNFTFSTNLATQKGGTYTIAIDVVNDGQTGGPGDVFLTGVAKPGLNSVPWNGKANDGSPIHAGDYKAQITLKTGEFHFTAADVETSGGDINAQNGLTINAVRNDGSIDYTNTVYWDDTTVLGSTASTAYNGDGHLKFHTWGNFGSGGIGNQSFIDTYTIGETTQEIPVRLVVETTNTTRKNIFGEVFYDKNGNGVRDNNEAGFSNITVALTEGNGNVFYVSTDTNGYYSAFVSSLDTSIGVDVYESMIPAGYVQTAGIDPQPSVAIIQQVTLPDGSVGYYIGQDGYRPPNPAYAVVKTQVGGPSTVDTAGQVLSYEINVTNTGNVDLTNVQVTDIMSNGATLSIGTPNGDTDGDNVLDVGETWVYTVTYSVTQDDLDAGVDLVNKVSVTTTQIPTPKTDKVPTPVDQHPNYTVVKTETTGLKADHEGQVLTYNITLKNTGNIDLTNIVATDIMPDGNSSTLAGQTGDSAPTGVLDVGETWVYTVTYSVTQDDLDAGVDLVNKASVITTQIPTPKTDKVPTPVDQHPNYSVVKTETTGLKADHVGQVLNYNITLKNTGNIDLTNIFATDIMPDGSSSTLTGQTGDGTNSGVLDVGETWVYTVTYSVTQDDLDAGVDLVNKASVITTQIPTPKTDKVPTPVIRNPHYTVVKTETTGVAAEHVDQTLHYKITLKNTGNIDLNDINVTDVMPDGNVLTLTTHTEDINTDNILNAGETWVYSVDYNVTQVDLDNNITLVNNVSVITTEIPQPKTDKVLTPIKQDNSLMIKKVELTGLSAIRVGQILNYEINVTNTGTVDIDEANVNVTDKLSNGKDLIVGTPVQSMTDDTKLEPGEVWTYRVDYNVTQPDMDSGTDIVNTASVHTPNVPETNSSVPTPIFQYEGLLIKKVELTGLSAIRVGQTLNYEIYVINVGNIDIPVADVNVTDKLSNGKDLIVGTPVQSMTDDTKLEPGEVWTYRVDYNVTQPDMDSGADIVNTATVKTPTIPETNSSVPTPVNQHESLLIEKVELTGVSATYAGQTLSYEINVTNTGNVDIAKANVNVTDKLSNGKDLIVGTPVQSMTDNDIFEPSEVWTYTVDYNVTQSDMDAGADIINTASVKTPNVDTNSSVPTPVNQHESLLIEKVELTELSATRAGQILNYEINVTNTGNVDIAVADVNVTDTLSTGQDLAVGAPIESNQPANSILEPGEVLTYTVNYTVLQTDMDSGLDIENTATVKTPSVTETNSSVPTHVYQIYDYNITKVEKSGINVVTHAGQILNYEINVTNTGNTDLDGLIVIDNMPDGSIGILSGPGATDLDDDQILDVGESWIYDVNYTVTQWDIDHKIEILNHVQATTTILPTPKDAQALTPVTKKPKFTVTKAQTGGPNPVTAAGDTIIYAIDVNNTGFASLTYVDLVENFPGLGTNSLDNPLGDVQNIGVLDVGESWRYVATYTVTQEDMDTKSSLLNVVIVTTNETPNPLEANATTPVEHNPFYTVVKETTSIPTQVGDTLDYTFSVENTGNITLTDINLRDLKCATPIIYSSGDIDGNSTILSVGETQEYSCTSIGVTQAEIDAGEVYNEVKVTVTPPIIVPIPPPVDANTTNQVPRASLGDKVWYDNNPNGIQDVGEHGVDGVKVYLLDDYGTRIQHNGTDVFTETNSTGEYIFERLLSGREYAVEFDLSTLPTGHYEVTDQDMGTDESKDSDAYTTTGKTDPVFLTGGQYYEDMDMGIKLMLAHIGDYFWIDYDQNGLQDSGEEHVIGAKIELLDEQSNIVFDENGNDVVITDSNGYYGFDVLPGKYKIRFNIPSAGYEDYIFTSRYQGTDHRVDSNVDKNGLTDTITVKAGDNNLTIDAGVNCGCENAPIKANGGETLGLLGMLGMMLITLLTGLFFVRKEEQRI